MTTRSFDQGMIKYALAAVFGLAVASPSLAQQFPDVVPPEHWAYDAVLRLKEAGILIGYPDGNFRGPRNATRYEMAIAIYRTYDFLKKILDAHDARLAAAMERPAPGTDMEALKAAIKTLQDDVEMIKRWRSEIDDLKRLAAAFERELASLGVDVAAIKKDIGDLQSRVGILEQRKPTVDIHGDSNFVSLAGYSDDPFFGITVDGRMAGVGAGSYAGAPVGMDKDLNIWHDMAVSFTGTNPSGPQWGATIAMSNMFSDTAFNNQSELSFSATPFEDDGAGTWYLQDAWVSFPSSIGTGSFTALAGRFGHSIGPYILMRPDNSPYYTNERWDNGKWMMDGAMLGFNFGAAKLGIFLARVGDRANTSGNDIQQMFAGQDGIAFVPGVDDRPIGYASGGSFLIDRALGATLNVPITQNGSLNLAYMWLGSDIVVPGVGPGGEDANGVVVFGGDLRFNLGGPVIEAGYSQSDVVYNNHRVIDEDNAAWYAKLGWSQGRLGANVGYRRIEPQFAAPGWWGRVGIWWNPVDIQGFMADAFLDINNSTRLTASGEFYTGTETTIGAFTGLSNDDELRRYLVGLAVKLNSSWDVALGLERVEWDLVGLGRPTETWYNIGFDYALSRGIGLKLLWQISDYDSKGVVTFNPFAGLAATRARGGVGVAQLSIKY